MMILNINLSNGKVKMDELLVKTLIGAGGATPSTIACVFIWKRLQEMTDKYIELTEKNIEGRTKTETTLRAVVEYIKRLEEKLNGMTKK